MLEFKCDGQANNRKVVSLILETAIIFKVESRVCSFKRELFYLRLVDALIILLEIVLYPTTLVTLIIFLPR